jgi:ribosomal-protein-alanine N-acetyltransferase
MYVMAIPSVRRARREDLPRIHDIERDSFRHPYPPYLIDMLFEENRRTFFVAEVEDRIVGYSVASIEARNTGHVISVAVSPDTRRRGIGEALTQRLTEELRKIGVSLIKLEVERDNIAAQNMYKKLGFGLSHIIKGYYENGSDALVMTLAL